MEVWSGEEVVRVEGAVLGCTPVLTRVGGVESGPVPLVGYLLVFEGRNLVDIAQELPEAIQVSRQCCCVSSKCTQMWCLLSAAAISRQCDHRQAALPPCHPQGQGCSGTGLAPQRQWQSLRTAGRNDGF